MKRLVIILLFAIALGIVSLSAYCYFQNRHPYESTSEFVTVPFYAGRFGYASNKALFRGWVNGRAGLFQIDTGSSATLDLAPSFAESSGVKITGQGPSYWFGKKIDNKFGKLDNLALGEKEKFLELDPEHLVRIPNNDFMHDDELIQGLLGNGILVPHKARIDFESGKISFYYTGKGVSEKTNETQSSVINSKNKICVPFVRSRFGIPYIHIKIGDAEGVFLVDVGAMRTLLSPEFLKRSGLSQSRKFSACITFNGNKENKEFIEIPEVKFGSSEGISSPFLFGVFNLNALNESSVSNGLPCVDGTIGCDFLIKHKAYIDYGSSTVTFSKAGRSSIESFFMNVRHVLDQVIIVMTNIIENNNDKPQEK